MTHEPRTKTTIYESLRDGLKNNILGLTNFTETSFNYIWTQAFSDEFRDLEVQVLDAQLSGWVDYAGGPIDEEDLEQLGVEDVVDPEDLDQKDIYLDELVRLVGTTRDQGTEATGTVTFTTQSAPTTIPEGTRVGTQPDANGDFFEFVVDTDDDQGVSNGSGETTVDAPIIAQEVGQEYNVGSGTITYMPSPPTGVRSVTNASATSGGEDRESNDELRNRAKNSIFANSGGGTVEGVKGFISNEVDGVDEVEITEFFTGDDWHGDYPHAHVIVNGGNEQEVLDAIDESRPVAVQHVLIRPTVSNVRVDVSLEGTDIDKARVEERITDYIDQLGLNEEVVDVKVIQRVMNADDDIEDIASLEFYMENESIFFDSSQDVYDLEQGSIMADDGIVEVTGTLSGANHTFVEDTDYQEWNTSAGDTSTPHDAIDWSLGGDNPDVDTGETKDITYDTGTFEYFIDDSMITNGVTDVTGSTSGTFTEGVDYEEVDVRADGVINGITFDINDDGTADGATPNDDETVTVTYDAGTSFDVTYKIEDGQDIQFDKESDPQAGTINVTVV